MGRGTEAIVLAGGFGLPDRASARTARPANRKKEEQLPKIEYTRTPLWGEGADASTAGFVLCSFDFADRGRL